MKPKKGTKYVSHQDHQEHKEHEDVTVYASGGSMMHGVLLLIQAHSLYTK